MDVYHGTWIPVCDAGFDNHGQFIFWVERRNKKPQKTTTALHPNHVSKLAELNDFLATGLSLTKALIAQLKPTPMTCYITLPGD